MALFGGENSADNAVKAAIDMQTAVISYNKENKNKKFPEINIGIGINTGEVVMGTIGSPERLNSTVIGDHVNVAARLEKLTKRFNAQIIISEYTRNQLKNINYNIREVDTAKLKGRSQPVKVYEVFDANPDQIKNLKNRTKKTFAKSIDLYRNGYFAESRKHFQYCLETFSQDGVAFEYMVRCNYFQKYPPVGQFWGGIVEDPNKLFNYLNRKRPERYELKLKSEIYYLIQGFNYNYSQNEPIEGIISNFSLTGVKLKVTKALEVGTAAVISISFEGTPLEHMLGGQNYKLLGRVVWQQKTGTELKISWDIGMEFIVLEQAKEMELEVALEKFSVRN